MEVISAKAAWGKKKMSSLKHSLPSCHTKQINLFPSVVDILAYITHLSVPTKKAKEWPLATFNTLARISTLKYA